MVGTVQTVCTKKIRCPRKENLVDRNSSETHTDLTSDSVRLPVCNNTNLVCSERPAWMVIVTFGLTTRDHN